ncbi:hypothetical protein Bca52824_020406 [Brassica carinata]|uniref:Prolamin-like domain-containing protein n=1 Tax=Brassica carinata TaxID=52824 RepID=A0A8X7VTN5_BRACI|nr:hypothetical protein Bca52824_020406 [Brassica carinata]
MLKFTLTVGFFMSYTTCFKEFDRSPEVPKDASPTADSPTMEYNMKLGRHYSEKQFDFLQICLQKLNSDCGDNIFKNMLDKTTTQLTNECCRDLLKIGRDCHLKVAHIISSNTEYINFASKAILKSKHTWKDCVRRVGSHIGAPIFLEELN